MKIAVSGSTGLVGSAFRDHCASERDDEMYQLVRDPEQRGDRKIYWSASEGEIESDRLNGFDAVVHLAGEPIVGRWNEEKKERIRKSRMEGTRLLAETLANCEDPPETLLCASAIGYYGDRGEEEVSESSSAGDLFLSEVCEKWEAACEPARDAGIRVANMRFGIILSPEGGALRKMLLPFKLGIGGPIGSGDMWMSWIDLTDTARAIAFLLDSDLSGPVNFVAPEPVKNSAFTNALGSALWRPTLLPIPKFGLRLLYGEMADELLFASTRVTDSKLIDAGFEFSYPKIDKSLNHLLNE